MTTADLQEGGRGRLAGQVAIWTGAAALVLAAHALAVAWALRRPSESPAAPSSPVAVLIELAPPAAPADTETEIAPDPFDTPPVMAEAPDAVLPPRPATAPPEPEVRPLVDTPSDAAEPAMQEDEVPDRIPPVETPPEIVAEVAAPRPMARPENLKPPSNPVEKAEPAPTRETGAPAQAQRRARVENTTSAEAVRATQNSRGARADAETPARWQAQLLAHLERRKRYPAAASRSGAEGTPVVRISVDAQGRVLSAGLVRSSGHASLDREVVAMARRASPVPPPPPGVPRTFDIPVRFEIR